MLTDKTILVTGASSGIGLGIVKVLAALNAKLILTGRNEKRLKSAVQDLEGVGHDYITADLVIDNQVKTLISKLPPLDGIVFSAGNNEFMPFKFINREKTNKIFEINYFSPIDLLKRIIKNKLLAIF